MTLLPYDCALPSMNAHTKDYKNSPVEEETRSRTAYHVRSTPSGGFGSVPIQPLFLPTVLGPAVSSGPHTLQFKVSGEMILPVGQMVEPQIGPIGFSKASTFAPRPIRKPANLKHPY